MSTQLTPAIVQAFADGARRGIPIATTCRLLQVPESTFQSWCVDAEATQRSNGRGISQARKAIAVELVSQIQRAQAEHEAELVARVANYQDKNGVHDWRASFALLTHGPSRKNWFQFKESRQTIDVQHHPAHTTVRELDDEALLMLTDGSEEARADD